MLRHANSVKRVIDYKMRRHIGLTVKWRPHDRRVELSIFPPTVYWIFHDFSFLLT